MQFLLPQEYRKNSAKLRIRRQRQATSSGRSSSGDHCGGLVLDPNSGPAITKVPKLEILPDGDAYLKLIFG